MRVASEPVKKEEKKLAPASASASFPSTTIVKSSDQATKAAEAPVKASPVPQSIGFSQNAVKNSSSPAPEAKKQEPKNTSTVFGMGGGLFG